MTKAHASEQRNEGNWKKFIKETKTTFCIWTIKTRHRPLSLLCSFLCFFVTLFFFNHHNVTCFFRGRLMWRNNFLQTKLDMKWQNCPVQGNVKEVSISVPFQLVHVALVKCPLPAETVACTRRAAKLNTCSEAIIYLSLNWSTFKGNTRVVLSNPTALPDLNSNWALWPASGLLSKLAYNFFFL